MSAREMRVNQVEAVVWVSGMGGESVGADGKMIMKTKKQSPRLMKAYRIPKS